MTMERSGSASNARCEADTMGHLESVCEIPLRAGVLRLIVPSMAVGIMIDRRCVVDWVEVTS